MTRTAKKAAAKKAAAKKATAKKATPKKTTARKKTPTAAAEPQVRYRTGGNNSVLLMVLHEIWQHRCYWCRKPHLFAGMQIDHILARSTAPERLQELIDDMRLPADFDVNAPANLAPICGPCNNEKREDDYADVPRLMRLLARARRLEPEVITAFRAFVNTNTVGAGLVALLEADLDDQGIRDAVATYAPELARTMAALGHDLSAEVIADTVEIHDVVDGGLVPIAIATKVIAAITTMEQLCGHPAAEMLEDGAAAIAAELGRRVQHRLDGYDDDYGPAASGPAQPTRLSLTIDTIEVARVEDQMEFTLAGAYEGDFTNSLARSAVDGDGLDELQADTELTGRYTCCAGWAISRIDGHYPRFNDVEITAWNATSLVWGIGSTEHFTFVTDIP